MYTGSSSWMRDCTYSSVTSLVYSIDLGMEASTESSNLCDNSCTVGAFVAIVDAPSSG